MPMMIRISLLFILFPLVFSGCKDLNGCWKNEKESVLKVDQNGNVIGGKFKTAVESSPGAGGKDPLPVTGWTNSSMISFSVLFPASVVGFIGECYETNGTDVMETLWLLLSHQDSIEKHWMSTRVGNDRFTRLKECPFEEDSNSFKNIFSKSNMS